MTELAFYVRPAPGKDGDAMAKFTVEFVNTDKDDEEVSADGWRDSPPFVDFYTRQGAATTQVARYRADDISRITREG